MTKNSPVKENSKSSASGKGRKTQSKAPSTQSKALQNASKIVFGEMGALSRKEQNILLAKLNATFGQTKKAEKSSKVSPRANPKSDKTRGSTPLTKTSTTTKSVQNRLVEFTVVGTLSAATRTLRKKLVTSETVPSLAYETAHKVLLRQLAKVKKELVKKVEQSPDLANDRTFLKENVYDHLGELVTKGQPWDPVQAMFKVVRLLELQEAEGIIFRKDDEYVVKDASKPISTHVLESVQCLIQGTRPDQLPSTDWNSIVDSTFAESDFAVRRIHDSGTEEVPNKPEAEGPAMDVSEPVDEVALADTSVQAETSEEESARKRAKTSSYTEVDVESEESDEDLSL